MKKLTVFIEEADRYLFDWKNSAAELQATLTAEHKHVFKLKEMSTTHFGSSLGRFGTPL